jgi:hypothetical protein
MYHIITLPVFPEFRHKTLEPGFMRVCGKSKFNWTADNSVNFGFFFFSFDFDPSLNVAVEQNANQFQRLLPVLCGVNILYHAFLTYQKNRKNFLEVARSPFLPSHGPLDSMGVLS